MLQLYDSTGVSDPAFGVSCDFSRVLWWIQCLEARRWDVLRCRRLRGCCGDGSWLAALCLMIGRWFRSLGRILSSSKFPQLKLITPIEYPVVIIFLQNLQILTLGRNSVMIPYDE